MVRSKIIGLLFEIANKLTLHKCHTWFRGRVGMQGQSGFAYVPSLSTNGDSFCFLLQDGIFVDIFGGLHAAVC